MKYSRRGLSQLSAHIYFFSDTSTFRLCYRSPFIQIIFCCLLQVSTLTFFRIKGSPSNNFLTIEYLQWIFFFSLYRFLH